jgi:hypothetical protein
MKNEHFSRLAHRKKSTFSGHELFYLRDKQGRVFSFQEKNFRLKRLLLDLLLDLASFVKNSYFLT